MKYVGIDIGSTYIKSALIDPEERCARNVRRVPSPERRPDEDPGMFEVNAREYVDIVVSILNREAEECGRIDGLLLSTQMHGFVIDDTYVSWQDSRCMESMNRDISYLDYLKEKITSERMTANGVYIKPSLGLCNLYAKLHKERRLDEEIEIYTLGSYIIWSLTGNNVCHISNAAPLGLADIRNNTWDTELLRELGITGVRLPEIAADDYSICGTYKSSHGEIAVYPDYGDQQVSIFGSGAEDNEAIVNVATASQICSIENTPEPGAYEVRPYFGSKYLRVVSNMPGGRNLDVLAAFMQDVLRTVTGDEYSKETVYESLPEAELISSGLEADVKFYPTAEVYKGGSIGGIRENNLTVQSLFSAAFRDMADEYIQGLKRITDISDLESLVCIGGVSKKNKSLTRTLQNISGIRCRLSGCDDEAVNGLCRIAGNIAEKGRA